MELTKPTVIKSDPKRFKQTEVGMIPEDWEVIKLGDSLKFKNGLNKESKFFGFGTPIINYMDVFKNGGIWKNQIHGKVHLSVAEINNFSANKGDVFFTRTSETQEEIGISSVLLEEIKDCVFSGFVLRGRPINKKITSEFYQFCLTPNYIRKQIISTSSYTTRALTNGRFLSQVYIALPPTLAEQTAIATALSDADAWINSLEKLITKKRLVKQGAMQELLKPKKGWEVKSLGEVLIKNPDYGINAAAVDFNDKLPTYLRITDISEEGKYIKANKVSVDNPLSENYELESGDMVFTRTGASVGKTYLYKKSDGKLIFAGFLIRVKTNKKILNSKFLFYITQTKSYSNWIISNSMRSGQPGINSNELKSFVIHLPNIDEQTRIASILSDMDIEFDKLEEKLAKAKQVKQGMMQELLTGRVRLV